MSFAAADPALFRRACAQFATGVTAVTARAADGELAALTANSFTSVSLEPPLVLVCVGRRMSAYATISRADRLAIHVLAAGQGEVARRLATSGLDGAGRLEGVGWEPDADGTPLIAGCAAAIRGPIVERFEAGDHVIFLVGAERIELGDEDPALLFFRGDFGTAGAARAA